MKRTVQHILTALFLLSGTPAHAQKVAVLELRTGTAAAQRAPERIAALLESRTRLSVLGPEDARHAFGEDLDGAVATCRVNPRCLSKLGRKLGVDQILLVGITELGNVILDLVLVDCHKSRLVARTALSLPLAQKAPIRKLFEAVRRIFPRSVFVNHGAIRVDCNLRGAQVRIAGKVQGRTPLARAITVRAPAKYKVEVLKKGYVPFGAVFFVPPKATITVRAELMPLGVTHRRRPVYKRWWFWTLVAGGVALAAGTTAGLILYHNAQTQPTHLSVTFP